MPIRAVLFDLDGTLVDTLADVASSMNAALALRGLPPHATADYAPWIGDGVRELAARALGGGSTEDEVDALVRDFRAHYAEHLVDRSRPYEGIPELLDALDARGLPMAVLTNKPHDTAERVVESLFGGRFRVVLGHRPGEAPKPDPAGAREVLARLGVAPDEALLLGDTEIDVRTARSAGLRAIAATWGFRSADALRAERPDALVDRPLELLDHLE